MPKNYRDALTGQYTTAADAAARPGETVSESVPTRHEAPDVAELRRLAEAATPGPWWHEWVDGDDWWAVYGQPTGDMVCPEVCTMWGADESAYIAAANPAAVLGLLDEADALRAELAHMTEARDNARAERDAALRTMDEHRCDEQAERAYGRAMRAEAERDAHRERAERAEARATAAEVASRGYRERAEKAEAKAARFAGLLGHQSRTLTDTIAAEVLRQKADAWDEGHHAGHEEARAVHPTYPDPTPNPYRQTEGA